MYQLNPSLKSFWRTRKPVKILKGGRFSGKTHDAGGMAAFLARNYSIRFLCLRQFQNRISDSVYTVIKEKIEAAGWLHEFDIGVSTIRHIKTGSEFLFYGIARNLADIKGIEGVDICWIEEGEGLTKEQWLVIDPTIRKEGSEIWLIYNPRLKTDFVETEFLTLVEGDYITRHINYDENPFLSATAQAKAKRTQQADPETYNHVYLGHAQTDDDNTVIKLSWVEAAINAHLTLKIDLTGARTVGYDVADSGDDKNATALVNGNLCLALDQWQGGEDELKQSALRAWAAVENGHLIYDSIGVGAHVGSTLKDIQGSARRYHKFNAGAGVANPGRDYLPGIKNKEKFENLKAQAWQEVADLFRNTYNAITKGETYQPSQLISISSEVNHLEKLKQELTTPRKRYSKRGLDMIETKEEMAKRGVPSPNLADAFIMAYSSNLVRKQGNYAGAMNRKF